MNMQALMKQAQKLQSDMVKSQKEIENMTFIGKSSLVTVEFSGDKTLKTVKINSENFEMDDLEMLEDMITIAINDAINQINQETERKMGKFKNIPGLM